MSGSDVPVGWETQRLSQVILLSDSGTWGDPGSPADGLPVLRSTNISEWELDLNADLAYRCVSERDQERKRLQYGDIIVTKSSGSPHLIGEAALFNVRDEQTIYLFSNFTQRLRPDQSIVIPRYLHLYLKSPKAREVIGEMQRTTSGLRNLKLPDYEAQPVPLPSPDDPARSLETQRHIVARIEALFAELREARRLHDEIVADTRRVIDAAIRETFDRSAYNWQTRQLSDVASIQTGTAKGRSFGDRKTVELPYLRVANVQAGYLDLHEVKTIRIAENEIDRYRLQPGDLLLTEGGDFDKLGRGAVWHGEIEPCVHQNHIFAVRFDQDVIQPEFAEYEMLSWHAKRYFLGVAKKTTNLATITDN